MEADHHERPPSDGLSEAVVKTLKIKTVLYVIKQEIYSTLVSLVIINNIS